jgi:glucan phosphoethanolaminetransferase (alkaline phosphatase superfamily)
MSPEQYRFTVALVIFSTPLIVLTNFKFNSFGRYFTIVLLALYSAIAISHVVTMIKIGDYAKEIEISLAFLVAVVNFYVIYYFLGKPYRDRLQESKAPRQQPEKSDAHKKSPQKAARRRRSKKS